MKLNLDKKLELQDESKDDNDVTETALLLLQSMETTLIGYAS